MMWWTLLLACQSPDPVPDDLSEPTVWLLGGLDRPDDEVAARIEQLDAYARTLSVDGDAATRSFLPATPTEDHLEDAGGLPPVGPLIGAGLSAFSQHELDDHLESLAATPPECAAAGLYDAPTRTWLDGEACFPTGSCDDGAAQDALHLLWDDAAFDTTATWRWRIVPLLDGRDGFVGRSVLDAATGPTGALRARFALRVIVPDPVDLRRSWHIAALWVDAEHPGATTPLGDRLLDELDASLSGLDDHLDGLCPSGA